MDSGIRGIAQLTDQAAGLLTVIVHAVTGGLFQIGLLQQVQHRLGGTLAIITFKADHKIAPFRFNRSLRAEYPTAYLSIIKSVPLFVKKTLCRKAAAAAYREQNKKSGRFLASARIFNKFSGYRG